MIRIAFLAPVLITGGTQRHLQQVLARLDRTRFEARVYTLRPGGDVEGELRAEGVPVVSLALGRLVGARTASAVIRAGRTLRAEGVQIVHAFQWRPSLVATVLGRLAGIPLVLSSKRSLTGADVRARRAWRVIGRRVDTIVVNAEAVRDEAEAQGVIARWELIPSGVDVDRFRAVPDAPAAKAALGLDPLRPVVGAIGRLEERKGHEDFLRAARVVRERANGRAPQLLIVGDGPLRGRLARQAEELGMADAVRFTGRLADVRMPLAAMDVFVLPSHAEGMSNALLEAMAAGRPVVATAVGGTTQVVHAERTGVLVPPADRDALADAVLGLLTDGARAARLAEAAQRDVAERFGVGAMVARLERLYEERLAARGARAAG